MEKMALAIEREPMASSFINPFIEGQLSEHTRRAYRGDVAAFMEFVEARRGQPITDLDQLLPTIQKEEVLAFRNAMATGGYSPSTINRRLSTVRQLFEDGKERGIVEHNVAKKVKGFLIAGRQDLVLSPPRRPRHFWTPLTQLRFLERGTR